MSAKGRHGKVPAGHWLCARCKSVNKDSHRYCDKCFNEPTAGRRDVDPEGRKFSSDTEPT